MRLDPSHLRQKCFQAPYCPNEACSFHLLDSQGGEIPQPEASLKKRHLFYRSKGWAKTKSYPYLAKCFQCKHCLKSFRYSTFKLGYREKKKGIHSKVFHLFTTGASNREIGRRLGVSEHLVRLRLKKMAQWALLKHTRLTESLKIQEELVYDGLENFAQSQYDPNHIQQVVGKDSLFIYDFNFAPLNRKGRMSERQKLHRHFLENTYGRYQPKAIRIASRRIFQRIYEKRADLSNPLILYSDEHFQYQRALQRDLKHLKVEHVRISSQQTRNFQNKLFAVNHADLLIRQHVGAFSRETICFSKTPSRMIHKYVLFLVWKNYFRFQFVKKHKLREKAHQTTPAMDLGLAQAPLKFHEFFDLKHSLKQVPLNSDWKDFYFEKLTFPRRLIQKSA